MTRRPGQLGTHRVIIGIVMMALLLLAVYIAFGSTRGVPFRPTYTVFVEVPNAAQLKPGADVLVAGKRVGLVKSIEADATDEGEPTARVRLNLEDGFERLPEDSNFSIHLTGSFGRKTVEIIPGTSSETIADGETVPLSAPGEEVVDIDEVLNAFDEGARTGTRQIFETIGTGAAGRSETLNSALQHLPEALAEAQPAMRTFSDPNTQLGRFVASLTALGGELAPVSGVMPGLIDDLDTTFTALDSIAVPYIQQSIERSPETLSSVRTSLIRTRPILRSGAALFAELQPGVQALSNTATPLADAIYAGVDAFPRWKEWAPRFVNSSRAAAEFTENPVTIPGIRRLTRLYGSLDPLLQFVAPAETTCSYASLLIRNLSSVTSEDTATGTSIRASGIVTGVERNSERGPASSIANFPVAKAVGPVHSNPYPNTASPGQPRECEAGNEAYITSRPVIGNVPSLQEAETEDPVANP